MRLARAPCWCSVWQRKHCVSPARDAERRTLPFDAWLLWYRHFRRAQAGSRTNRLAGMVPQRTREHLPSASDPAESLYCGAPIACWMSGNTACVNRTNPPGVGCSPSAMVSVPMRPSGSTNGAPISWKLTFIGSVADASNRLVSITFTRMGSVGWAPVGRIPSSRILDAGTACRTACTTANTPRAVSAGS
jgi:hypothetical protein